MKILLSISLILFSISMAWGEFEAPHLAAYGTAETLVIPDEMHWTLMVETKGQAIEEVAQQHLKEVAVVIAYLNESRVEEEDIKTSRMQLRENWTHRGGSRLKDGYVATTGVTFKTLDFDTYVAHWTQLSRFKNLSISSVRLGISNVRKVQDQTLLKAIEVAKENAGKMACVLGVELLEPLLLEEPRGGGGFPIRPASTDMRMMESPGGNVVSPGTETITATVKVVYRISGEQ